MEAQAKIELKWKRLIHLVRGLACLLAVVSCQSTEKFTSQATTDQFSQDYNPPYVDFLWVIDNRSPMNAIATQLTADSTALFTRLDATASQYRMGFVTMDMLIAKGALQPTGNPAIIVRNYGTAADRAQNFHSIFASSLNLHTGADADGFQAALIALQNGFVTNPTVPLVLIFASDSDDVSPFPAGTDAVTYYSKQFLALKNNNADLVRAYSIDLEPLATPTTPKTSTNRCTTIGNAAIDKTGYTADFFGMATALGGSTGDLCASFGDQIDISGIKLKTLPTSFTLTAVPDPTTIQVSVFYANQSTVPNQTWTYDSTNNAVVFAAAPPEGTNIEVTYNSASKK